MAWRIVADFVRRVLRNVAPVKWYDLRTTIPVSRLFGLERGTPIDRYYIERFLHDQRCKIKGVVMEIAESDYSHRFGTMVERFEVLHVSNSKTATVVGDLTSPETLPNKEMDCFICTQTLNFIYDFQRAIQGIHRVLRPGGSALVTVSGLSQISEYDMSRWGDYWRFTDLSIRRAFSQEFGEANVQTCTFGNVLSATAFLQGISAEELRDEELDCLDSSYQVIIGVAAKREKM